MKKILLLTLICVCSHVAFSQAHTIRDLNSLYDQYIFEKSKNRNLDASRYAGIAGSPFLNEEFINGQVIINDTIQIINVPLRYNIYTDKIEFTDAEGTVLEANTTGKNFVFLISDHQFLIRRYQNQGKTEFGFLELLVDGNIKLYKKYTVEFQEAVRAMGYQDPRPNKFVRHNDTFLIAIGDEIPEAVIRRRDLLTQLRQSGHYIDQYLKNNSLRMSAEETIVSLIRYCNQNP